MEAQRPAEVAGSVWRLERTATGFLADLVRGVLHALEAALVWLHDEVLVPARVHLLSIDALSALIGLIGDATRALGEVLAHPEAAGFTTAPPELSAMGSAVEGAGDVLRRVEGVVEDLIPTPDDLSLVTGELRLLLAGRLTIPDPQPPPGLFTTLLVQLEP